MFNAHSFGREHDMALLRFLLLITVATLLLIAGVESVQAREPEARPGRARLLPRPNANRPPPALGNPANQAGAHGAENAAQAREQHPAQMPAHEADGAAAREPLNPVRPGNGRLTPDERRALRKQIDEAGRDVYRPQRP